MDIRKLLQYCVQYDASDLHLLVGVQPIIRLYGKLMPVPESQVLTPESVMGLISDVLGDEQKNLFEVDRELDFSYSLPSGVRFRVNAYHEKGVPAAAFRVIPLKIRSIEELGLPNLLGKLANLKQGLILVTGPTGHGKSTTQAAMIEKINQERAEHIVTIEDPIEYVYTPAKSIISQRELHSDTHSWSVALRSVLREDPDIVLVGELRDYETIAATLTVAETGHLVFGTLHTNNAAQTVDRIVDVFPDEQQQQVRAQFANVIEAILSQRLIPSVDGKRVAVMEILLGTPAVASIIREGKPHLLPNVIQTSGEIGMRGIDAALAEAHLQNKITVEVGRSYADNLDEFNRLISRKA